MEKTREPVIKINGLKKRYRMGQISGGTLTADLQSWWARVRGREDPNMPLGTNQRLIGKVFWALNGVDLTIHKGEVVGIIGMNGAGKSTLLKILSRITAPTEGEVRIKGRIASMLEVGTGFSPEMTGRENVYLNGAILGMSKAEIDAKMDDIIAFSECADFIDTPVKRYSSGMYVKLAFSVAAHLDSDILIMDEVLAVGDAKFQKKCLGKMGDAATEEGKTVLYVSHNMATIRQLCSRVVVLKEGRVIYDGEVEDGIAVYMENNTECFQNDYDLEELRRIRITDGTRIRMKKLHIEGDGDCGREKPLVFTLTWKVLKDINSCILRVIMYYQDESVAGVAESENFDRFESGSVVTQRFSLNMGNFGEGSYYFCIDILEKDSLSAISCIDSVILKCPVEVSYPQGRMQWHHPWWGHTRLDDIVCLETMVEPDA